MIKTQIQIPDELYRQIKAFSRQREWSLAETFRRGAEQLVQQYPTSINNQKWTPPKPMRRGSKEIDNDTLKKLSQPQSSFF